MKQKGEKGHLKTTLVSTCIMAMSVSLLAACNTAAPAGSITPAAKETAQVAENKALLDLSIMTIYYGTEPPKADNEIIDAYEKLLNVKYNTTWVPSASYNDKVNTTIASNTMPKVMLATDIKAPIIVNSARSGAFWEIGPLLKDYPNLSKMNPISVANSSIDGKTYGLYRPRPLSRAGVVFRKDWLDSIGMKAPTTIDEFYKMLQAFKEKDPDKNGKNDTIPFYVNQDLAFTAVSSWFGVPNKWEVKDNKLSPEFMTKEYLEAMKFYKKLYAENLINQDFAVAKSTQIFENINKGKTGVYVGNMGDSTNKHADLYKLFPNAQIDVQNVINGTKGAKWPSEPGFNGVFLFPKTSVKTEAELKRILAAFDKLSSQEGTDLQYYGIKGKHWELENGKVKKLIDTDSWNKLKNDVWAYELTYTKETSSVITDKDSPLSVKVAKATEENEKMVITNPGEAIISDTFSTKGPNLEKIYKDARTKFVMGQLDEAGWNAAIEQWRKEGGDKIIEEVSAGYAKKKK